MQIGDRVYVTGEDFFGSSPEGFGILVAKGESLSSGVTVAFDNWSGGHDGRGLRAYPEEVRSYITGRNLWFCRGGCVKLVVAPEQIDMHPDNLKYIKIINKIKYLDRKFKERTT